MEKTIRVLVANRPRLMRELILETFADHPDIKVVGEVLNDVEIPEQIEKTLPDFVVIALDEPGKRPAICDIVLRQHPELRIIAVAPNQNYTAYYWASLAIHTSKVEASEEGILNTLRGKRDYAGDRS
jgi:chemotaxis response regulator CheB